MKRNKMELVDDMGKFGRSLGNLTALIHAISLTVDSNDIGNVELSRAVEAVWELSAYHEKKFMELEEKLELLEVKTELEAFDSNRGE